MRTATLAASLPTLPHATAARAQAPAPPPRHEESFEASYVGVSGNASSNTFGLGADIIARPDSWIFRHKASFVQNESKDVIIAKAIEYAGRAQKTLNARASAFGEYGFFRDRFAGIVPRHTVTAGVALSAFKTDRQSLALDLGAGYFNETRLASETLSSGSYVVGSAYRANLSETAALVDDIKLIGLFQASDNWRLEHTVAVTSKLAAGLSLKVSHAVRFANIPAPGFKKTDSVSAVTIVAKFAH